MMQPIDDKPDASADTQPSAEVDHSETTLGDLGLVPQDVPELHDYWPGLLRAIGTEPRDVPSLRGASGLDHEFIAAGVDEERKRLIVISSEPDAAGAAMAQADLQAAQSEVQVVLARAVVVDVAAIGKAIEEKVGRSIVLDSDLKGLQEPDEEQIAHAMQEILQPLVQQTFNARAVGSISFLTGAVQFIKQAASASWGDAKEGGKVLDLTKLLSQPLAAEDSAVGVCAIPLYAFTEDELAAISRDADRDEVEAILRKHDLLQYFFPPPDQTALGLIDRAPQSLEVIETLKNAPALGHPFGVDELVPPDTAMTELLDQLKERKYVAEIDYGLELTDEGKQVRTQMKVKPREGLISKLINRVSVTINFKSLFKIG